MSPSSSTNISIAGLSPSTAIDTVDEVDLTAFDHPIRAIIIPKSESAVHSLRLHGNEGVDWAITRSAYLLPACDSSYEDGLKDTTRNPGQDAIVVKLSREREKFTLGASLDNDVVLEHIDSDSPDEDQCYINLVHVQLYPDPDHDAMLLYNSSTSTFTFRSLTTPRVNTNIPPNHETRLGCGSWRLTFGKGLDFHIKVVSRPPPETQYKSRTLISPPRPAKHSIKAVRPVLRKNKIVPPFPPPRVSTAKKGSGKKKIGAGRRTDQADTGLEMPGSRPSSASMQAFPIQHKIIFQTRRTLVYKATYKDAITAIKMCRGSRLKDSAENWRNEVEILTALDHPSIARLIRYDASDLRLELEYVGPDLSTFVDNFNMSKLSSNERHQVWIDVSSGLEYIHAKNILHLDIKPQNILLGPGGRVKICDFGFSVQCDLPIAYGGGTPNYIPPEYLHAGERGRPADVWAFGITILFVLGLMPLPNGDWKIADVREETNAQKKMRDWIKQVERILESIPETLLPLRQMLVRNPRNRITPSQIVSHLRVMPLIEVAPGELLV